MSEDNVTKIEPTLTPVVDAPSIAAAAEPEAAAAETARIEPKLETNAGEPAKVEPAAAETAKEPAMTRAAQSDIDPGPAEPPAVFRATGPNGRRGAPRAGRVPVIIDATAESTSTSAPRKGSRFPLLAATVAIAASFGAVAGSFGGTMFQHAPAPVRVAAHTAAPNNNAAEEIRALKETVTQLRAHTKTLSDNVAALKLSVSNTSAQLTKMNESIERRAAAPAAPETTGSIAAAKPAAAPVALGAPPAHLQHPVVAGWTLRRVYDGAALIEGREGVIEVEPGIMIPGIGRIDDIKKIDGRWAVLTSKGIIVSAR
jgi:hypothetical protein